MLLLSARDVESLALEVDLVKLLNSLGSRRVVGKVDEAEATVLTAVITSKSSRRDGSVLGEEFSKLLVADVGINVLDVDVGEVCLHLVELGLSVLLGNVVTNKDLLVIEQHSIDMLNGILGSLGGFVVNEPVSARVAVLILGNLARQDVTEGRERVVEGLVVDSGIKVLDEDITLAGLAKGGVTLRPHDAARLALNGGVVQLLESTLTISGVVVVDVGVSERTTGDGITADTDGRNGADGGEELEEHSLSDGGVKLSNVEGGRLVGSRVATSSLGSAILIVGVLLGSRGNGGRDLLDVLLSGDRSGNFGGRHFQVSRLQEMLETMLYRDQREERRRTEALKSDVKKFDLIYDQFLY